MNTTMNTTMNTGSSRFRILCVLMTLVFLGSFDAVTQTQPRNISLQEAVEMGILTIRSNAGFFGGSSVQFEFNGRNDEPLIVGLEAGDLLLNKDCEEITSGIQTLSGVGFTQQVAPQNFSLGISKPGFIMVERQAHTLISPVNVDFPAQPTLAQGLVVNSYLVHFSPGVRQALTAGVFFQEPIVGVIYTDGHLDASDSELGNPTSIYPTGLPLRGMEGISSPDDLLAYAGGSSQGLDFTMTVFPQGAAPDEMDQIRIITLAECSDDQNLLITDEKEILVPAGASFTTEGGFTVCSDANKHVPTMGTYYDVGPNLSTWRGLHQQIARDILTVLEAAQEADLGESFAMQLAIWWMTDGRAIRGDDENSQAALELITELGFTGRVTNCTAGSLLCSNAYPRLQNPRSKLTETSFVLPLDETGRPIEHESED